MPTRDGRVGFAIVGLGFGASRCAMVKAAPEAALVAVSDLDEGRAQKVAATHGCEWVTDFRRLLNRSDVDVVAVYTPSGLHLDVVREVAKAGKHVLTTKPIEVTLERVDELVGACRTHGVKLATEFYARYQPALYATHQAVTAGRFGRMILGEFSFKCYRGQDYYNDVGGWRGSWRLNGGGVMANQAVHAIDQAFWLMGDIQEVCAAVGTFTHKIETEDTAAAVLRFRSGAIGMLTGTTTFHNDRPIRTAAYGGGSFMRVEINGEHGSSSVVDGASVMWKIAADPTTPSSVTPPAVNVFQDYARWVRDDTYHSSTLGSPAESRRTVALVHALYESARTGAWTAVPGGDATHPDAARGVAAR